MGSRDPGHALFSKKKFRGHVGTIPEARVPNLKSVSLAILELLAFTAKNVHSFDILPPRDVVWTTNRCNRSTDDVRGVLQHSHWKCIINVPISGKWGKIWIPLLDFDAQWKGSLSGSTIDLYAKFRHNRIKTATVRAHTDIQADRHRHRHTSDENIISAVHLAEIINWQQTEKNIAL